MPSSAPAVDVPDPLPALKASLDDARGVEKKLRAELASVQDDLRKQLEHCKPAGPALPAERWSKGDLATLKGCWVLGRDVPMTRTFADGRREQVTLKAGRHLLRQPGRRRARAGHGRPDGAVGLQGAGDGEILEQRNAGRQPACRHV